MKHVYRTVKKCYRLGNLYAFVLLQIKYHPVAGLNLDRSSSWKFGQN